jgi:hypothetical protein
MYSVLGCCDDRISPSRISVMNPGQHSTEHASRRKVVVRHKMTCGAAGVLIILLVFLLYHALFVYHTDPGYEDNSYHDYLSSVTCINNGNVEEAIHVLEASIKETERHYAAVGRPADAKTDWQLTRNMKLFGDVLVNRRDYARAIGWLKRAKENYENLRARWPGNAELTSELADTLESSSVESLRRARIFSMNYAALRTVSGIP